MPFVNEMGKYDYTKSVLIANINKMLMFMLIRNSIPNPQ